MLAGRKVDLPLFNLILPLGISFYTFQLLGYVIDVYRGQYPVVRNPFKVALFKAFFPQLIAGPILRAHQFIWQLDSKREFQAGRLLHGAALAITRLVHELAGVKPSQPLLGGRAYRLLSIFVTFHLVCLGWVFFRAPTFDIAFDVLAGIGSFKLLTSADTAGIGFVSIGLTAALITAATGLHLLFGWARGRGVQHGLVWAMARPALFAGVAVGILLFAGRGPQQFIYFQF